MGSAIAAVHCQRAYLAPDTSIRIDHGLCESLVIHWTQTVPLAHDLGDALLAVPVTAFCLNSFPHHQQADRAFLLCSSRRAELFVITE